MSNFKKLIETLTLKGIIDEPKGQQLSIIYQDEPLSLLMCLLKNGYAQRDKLGQIWCDIINIGYTNLDKVILQNDIMQKLPKAYAKEYNVVPLYSFFNVITVATSNPTNSFLLGNVEKIVKSQISPVFSFPDQIEETIKLYYDIKSSQNLVIDKLIPENISIKTASSDSVFSDSTKKYFIGSSKNIVNNVADGKTPDPEVCENLSNAIIEEIGTQLEMKTMIHKLRIDDEYTYSHLINVAMLSSVFKAIFPIC